MIQVPFISNPVTCFISQIKSFEYKEKEQLDTAKRKEETPMLKEEIN